MLVVFYVSIFDSEGKFQKIREILGIDKKKVNASCSSDDIRSRDTDATLTKPALTRSQNSAPDISRAFRTAGCYNEKNEALMIYS